MSTTTTSQGPGRAFREHPSRRLIEAETHARPVYPIAEAARVRRLVFMSADGGGDLARLNGEMGKLAAVEAEGPSWSRQLTFARGPLTVTWERHNEFATLTWSGPIAEWWLAPEGIGLELHTSLLLLTATRLDVTRDAVVSDRAMAGFGTLSLCHSRVFGDRVEAATDFHLDADGFTRFELATAGCGDLTRGVIVRRLLEMDTYRNVALLGLPLARDLGLRVGGYEAKLAAITRTIAGSASVASHHDTLEALHQLSVEIGGTVEETSFRFAATRAYGEVLAERLERLEEQPIGEATTFERFLNNRVQPALATCEAMEKRLDELTAKVQRSIELLDARISLSIQTQNQRVLDTILATARSQYRLQETVEGLSIIAISYYALSLIGYFLEGFHDVLPIGKNVLEAIAAPIVLVVVFFGIRSLRRHGKGGE